MALSVGGCWDTCAAMVSFPRERFPMPASRRRRRNPFPNHYESTCIEGKQHPADAIINKVPVIAGARRRLSRLYEMAQRSAKDQAALRTYADAHGQYQSMRENLFYDAGYEHGLIRARQDNLSEGRAGDSAAGKLLSEINQIILSTGLPQRRVVMLLLETARALVFGIALPTTGTKTISPELAAIREVLWPGGDMEHEWSPDTIDEVARIARPPEMDGRKHRRRRG